MPFSDQLSAEIKNFNDALTEDISEAATEANTYTDTQITNRVIYSGGKNLLKITAVSQTITGVTFTVNEDGSVTANGTATALSQIYLTESLKLPLGKYTVSCEGLPNTYNMFIHRKNLDGTYSYGIANTYNGMVNFTLSEDYSALLCGVRISSGDTVNNLTVYPMIRLASIEDDTYEPYYASLVNLTNRGMDLLWENASPASEFGAQTISLDLSKYYAVYIICRRATSASQLQAGALIPVGSTADLRLVMAAGICSRVVTMPAGGITIGDNNLWADFGNNSYAVNNSNNIPVQIYGIKGVL